MNNVKTLFSIKDLENISGIKAHTIRIWEKRYKLLSPMRTDTNIRSYTLKSLQKLLNITLLYDQGVKISKISKLTEEEIKKQVLSSVSENMVKNLFINDMKLAMVNFDYTLFESSYQKLKGILDFKDIYVSYFIPFLQELGLLWQTDTVNPAQEHFITSLIKQKILVNTEKLQGIPPTMHNNRFVLFLPENEIHELGLTYANYEIIKSGYPSFYLGQSMSIQFLEPFLGYDDKITFVTFFTVEPVADRMQEYLDDFYSKILSKCNGELWVLGRKTGETDNMLLPKNVKFLTMPELLNVIQNNS